MGKVRKRRRLVDAYAFPGFRPLATVQGMFGAPRARLITLVRRGKKLSAVHAEGCIEGITTAHAGESEIWPVVSTASGSISKCAVWTVARVMR